MPIHENEVVMFALGVGVFFFSFASRLPLPSGISNWPLLRFAFLVLLVAWGATILEGFCLETVLNLLEHSCYALSAVLLAVWCWKVAFGKRGRSGQ